MNAKDFIIKSLNKISREILNINFRYAYDEMTKFHIIEVSPEDIRRGDEQYMDMEYDLWDSFRKTYPEEDLLISEVNDNNNMCNVLYENIASVSMCDPDTNSYILDFHGNGSYKKDAHYYDFGFSNTQHFKLAA